MSKTLVLGISTAETALLENTTDRNTSSGYHPVVFSNSSVTAVLFQNTTVF